MQLLLFMSGVILRPGFIYGDRRVGRMKVPLGVVGGPLEMVSREAWPFPFGTLFF